MEYCWRFFYVSAPAEACLLRLLPICRLCCKSIYSLFLSPYNAEKFEKFLHDTGFFPAEMPSAMKNR